MENVSSHAPVEVGSARRQRRHLLLMSVRRNYDLYLLILPVIAYFVIFHYIPMYGVQIAFRDFNPVQGIMGSPWAGLKHLNRFVNSFYFIRLIRNTIGISAYSLLVGIPGPIILAVIFNEVRFKRVSVVSQTLSYAPSFLSTVVVCGMLLIFLTPETGLVPSVLDALSIPHPVSMIAEPQLFWHIYVLSGVWQTIGWGSLIYTAAMSGIPVEMYEASIIDGASRMQRITKITIPSILPTIVIITILSVGSIMNVGFEKVFLLQNPINLERSEVISTYVYKSGILGAQFSFSAMVGLFNNVINFAILIAVNWVARNVGETSLW
jgi:putative aldouronate transport system permease protein